MQQQHAIGPGSRPQLNLSCDRRPPGKFHHHNFFMEYVSLASFPSLGLRLSKLPCLRSRPQVEMAIGKPEMLLMLVVAAWAATTGPAAATRPEDELLSWTPAAPNGLSLRPADTPDGSSLLSWWLGFKTAHIEESSSGTTFTQNPFVATVPPMPATTTSAPGTLDHVKHLAITVPINVSSTGRKLSYAVRMSAKMILPSELPYNVTNLLDDLRLGSCTALGIVQAAAVRTYSNIRLRGVYLCTSNWRPSQQLAGA
ncbi:hypothetical protein Vretifemale_6962 [Volvox reticuliferus]|uniref:Uncharacterized protein n=1 Tax=Volvox reticuliferus TaxID=1737510 RepID=A0A8J4C9S7_9CHLO|nr:hypothetical protein Vretifemale_6962 [Volvox reticuliferus]